jgi:putative ATPase
MKNLGYGAEYQYDHDVEGGIALDQTGFPDAMGERVYYQPVARGLEIKLKEKLDRLREARAQARADKAGGSKHHHGLMMPAKPRRGGRRLPRHLLQ